MPSYCDKQCPPMGLPRAIAEHGEATLRRMLQRMNNTSPLLRSIGLLACALAAACHDGGTPSPVAAPGEPTTAKTRALAAGAAALQSQTPIAAHDTYLDGFHFYNGRPQAQMEAHHYCNVLSEDLIQCVIYDGSRRDAKLMGIEYVLSARLFQTLPPAEKLLWHSHVHEVHSGQLVGPGLPAVAEKALMAKLVGTYGKTWHTWHTDEGHALPIGVPQLMMGFTADGQIDERLVRERDARLGIDSAEKRADRQALPRPEVDPAADAWRHGEVFQIEGPVPHHEPPPAKR